MCGLLGIAGPGIISRDLDNFRDLGIVSMLRGREGAGIWQTKTNVSEKIRARVEDWTKTPESFSNLLEELDDEKNNIIATSVNVDVLMGHCRWPTRGKRTVDNAHPYVYRSLVGMHNGTLRDARYQHADRTDSDMMFSDMTQRGVIEVLGDLVAGSAYAVSIYDRKKEVILFGRNAQRTLSFAILEDRNVMYWASEASTLRYILTRSGQKFQMYNLKEDQLFEVTPSKINCKKHDSGIKMIHNFSKTVVEEPKKEEVKEVPKVIENFTKGVNKATHTVIRHGGHPVVTLKNETKVVIQKGNNPLKSQSLKSFYTQCFCGTRHMNLMDSFLMKRGDPGMPTFNEQEGKFYCDDCLNNLEIAKNA